MNNYKGITFAKGYNKPFAEFKEEFGSTHVFNEIHPEERERELKKAYEIATSKDCLADKELAEIKVKQVEIIKPNGNTSGTISKVKENSAK